MSLSVDLLQQVDACCDRYESALRNGEAVDASELIAALPEAARDAARRELEEIEKAVKRSSSEAPTLAPPAGSGGMRLRCPHCEGGVEVLPDAPLEQITCGTCGSTFGLIDAPEMEDLAPRTVGRFRLLERLGVGGFGAVWRARDPELDRDVAVKLPRRGQLAPHEAELFFREARAAAQLAHPSIVPVHEVGRDETPGGGRAVYIVSELIRGEPLSDRLKRGRVDTRDAVELLAIVADALHYAHERGVIHRDLKPSNVMVDTDGKPYLMDFGLAKREVGEITMTVEGQVLGTPAYMSPEQAGGQVRWVDRRTDIYSLGVMLFQVLTGELPFRGTAQSQIQQRQTDDAPSPRRLDTRAPLDLATVCLKCLERDPNRRYASAMEVAEELRRYLRGEPVNARPLSRAERAWRWARRRPSSAAALVLGAVLAVVGPTAAVVIAVQQQQVRDELDEKLRVIAEDGKKIDRLREERDDLQGKLTGREFEPGGDRSLRRMIAEEWLEKNGDAARERAVSLPDPERATALLGLGLVQAVAEREADATRSLTEAEALLSELSGDSDPWRSLHALCCDRLAVLMRSSQKLKEADRYARLARESRSQAAGEGILGARALLSGPEVMLRNEVQQAFPNGSDPYGLARRLLTQEPLPDEPGGD